MKTVFALLLCLGLSGCYRDTCPSPGEEYPVLASKCKKAGYAFRIHCQRNGECYGDLFPIANKADQYKSNEWTGVYGDSKEDVTQRLMWAADEPLKRTREDMSKYDTVYDYTGPK